MLFQRKKKIKKPKTVIHKEFRKLVQKTMTLKDEDGNMVDLYEFQNLEDIPADRYSTLNEFIEDKDRGLSRLELQDNLEECISSIEGESVADFTNALILIKWMRQRLEIAYDLDLVMRLVSCAFFYEDEDVKTYDWDIGTKKIDLFKANDLKAFFLSEPIKRYWNVTNISDEIMSLIIEEHRQKHLVSKELREILDSSRSTK